jgi:hypothetical protein
MIDALYSYFTQYPESIKSQRLALELTGLVSKTSGKVEADTGCTDDIALSAACCMYVRKYDPPVMIDTQRYGDLTNEMSDIVNMNKDVEIGFNNKDIMKAVKDNYNDDLSFVDTLSFFKE